MIRALLTFVFFVVCLAVIGYGVLWFVDNRSSVNILKDEVGSSVESMALEASGVDQEGEKTFDQDEQREDVHDVSEVNDEQELQEQDVVLEVDHAIEILVLNGGGAKGSASAMQTYLQDQSYTQVQATNAKSYDYTGITVYFQDEKFAEQMVLELKEKYGEVKKEAAVTAGQKVSDIVIVIGQ